MHAPERSAVPTHVVGLVASAGGLDALLDLLPRLRPNGHTTWVVAQHMGGQAQGELMARLLSRTSALPVRMGQPDQALQADTVYIIPAGHDGRVERGVLLLGPPLPTSISSPSGNELFASLAASHAPRCTAVVLSGAGRDGVEGAWAVRQAGGCVLAQDPADSAFNGMPGAAVRAGVVDAALPIPALAEALNGPVSVRARDPGPSLWPDDAVPPVVGDPDADDWAQLLDRVRLLAGLDMGGYKPDTLWRRVQRRLQTLHLPHLRAYLAYGDRHPQEWHVLQHLFLVSYSVFFRDRAVFQVVWAALRERVRALPTSVPIRLWVPGCARGEEAYTFAIMLVELLGEAEAAARVSIWGTDLNAEALAQARSGRYRRSALREVEAPLVERHFDAFDGEFQVRPALQACCRFEQRNVFDPVEPAAFDMVSCRNVLIYLKPEWQARLLLQLHRALRPDGLLLVAPVESVETDGVRLFTALDRDHRLYRRRERGHSPTPME